LWPRLQDLPRHLGQHSGGMVIAAGRLDDVVPLEPATMPGRVVVQWDKEDCAALGIVKVDLLGLRMMSVLQESIALVSETGGVVDLAHLPADDPEVYGMLQRADTIGVFQVESRAQMATLPRIHPERFYDLVVQIAIIRPGPIVGDMVRPYVRRRRGREAVTYAHPSLEPILSRTLGVPLFQEQLLRIAMVAAGFSGSEAEELRRAFGFKRSERRMAEVEVKLREGMAGRGITGRAADEIVHQITSFALYGFPECVVGDTRVLDADSGRWVRIEDVVHGVERVEATLACDEGRRLRRRRVLGATASGRRGVYRLATLGGRSSFALLAYASAYLKTHHGPACYAALLNNQPMGFYHSATVVNDARRHGVRVLPVDVTRSDWPCTLERRDDAWVVRLGLRVVKGLRERAGQALVTARATRVFASARDLAARVGLTREEMATLATIGALSPLGGTRRANLWTVAEQDPGPLFAASDDKGPSSESPLREMSADERLTADYAGTGVTLGPHPMALPRAAL